MCPLSSYEDSLAPYAQRSSSSVGRRFPDPIEKPGDLRLPFQRDRDRIIHAKAFRRLAFKTQVYAPDENDHIRTRLSHSIEVSQIARGIGRLLNLNEDLIDAIALGHDLGHTPFGHAGETELNVLMEHSGDPIGFKHNIQSARVVTSLEHKRGLHGRGLNLTREVISGILHHGSVPDAVFPDLAPVNVGTVEAQVVSLVDDIAYSCADFEDAERTEVLRDMVEAGVITKAQLEDWYGKFNTTEDRGYSGIIEALAHDVFQTTKANLASSGFSSRDKRVVGLSKHKCHFEEFRCFLRNDVYRSAKATRSDSVGRRILRALFREMMDNHRTLPLETRRRFEAAQWSPATEDGIAVTPARVVADHISGMTDRYAMEQYRSLCL